MTDHEGSRLPNDEASGFRRFVDTVEHLTDTFTALDSDWTITYMNGAGLGWVRLSEHEVVGRHFWTVFPMVEGSAFGNALRRVMQTRVAELLETPSTRSGRWFESNIFPAGDGIAVLSRDIHARKAAEAALLLADRRKDEFLATLGHELRNPLAPIRTAAQVLRRIADTDTPARRAVDIIERQVEQLTRLVDDLLDVSRITRGQVELRHRVTDLESIVDQAIEAAGPLIEGRHHTLQRELPGEPMRLRGDPARLAQVISNLLHNAAKYTPEGGLIQVAARREDDTLVLTVRDNGKGLAPDDRERIFDLFTQVDRHHGYGGLGIGLTVARELAQRHGGSLSADSDGAGRGATFTLRLPAFDLPAFDLPASAHSDVARTDAPDPRRNGGACRVLVVDDNRDAADALASSLALGGHDVRVAYSGGLALDSAREYTPHAVLLDIGLPGMSGYDVARAMRADPVLAGVLLVAVTGWGAPEDRRKAREAGFDHHFVKPVDTHAVERLIRDAGASPRGDA